MDDLTRLLLPIATQPEQLARLGSRLEGLCSGLRSRLNCLRMAVYLAQHDPHPGDPAAVAALGGHAQRLEHVLNRLQDFLSPAHLVPGPVGLGRILDERLGPWAKQVARTGATFQYVAPETECPAWIDPLQLGFALDEFVSWRCMRLLPETVVRLTWGRQSGSVHWVWRERADGDGVSAQGPPRPPEFAGLALPVLARLVHLQAGHCVWQDHPHVRLELRLPDHPVAPATTPPPQALCATLTY